MQNPTAKKHMGKQTYTQEIKAGDFLVEFTLQPLQTEWSVPDLLQYGFRILPEVTEYDDVSVTMSVPVRIPSLRILSVQFENDLRSIPFSVFRGDDKYKSEDPIVLCEEEPEIDGHIYVEAVLLNKSYLYKYVFRMLLKKRPHARPKNQPVAQPQKPVSVSAPPSQSTKTESAKIEPVKATEEILEAAQRIKKLEHTSDELLRAIEGMMSGALMPAARPEPVEEKLTPPQPLPTTTAFDDYRDMLRQRFVEHARYAIDQSKAIVPDEMKENPYFKTFQKLLESFSSNNKTVQTLKQSDSSFRLPILKFNATVSTILKKILAPKEVPQFFDVTIRPFYEFTQTDYLDFLSKWLESEAEPPLEVFNQETAYRLYIFKMYQRRLFDFKSELAMQSFSNDELNVELKKIREDHLVEHVDEIEEIEKSLRASNPAISETIDHYLESIFAPLGLVLVRGGGESPSHPMYRGVQTKDGHTIRSPKAIG